MAKVLIVEDERIVAEAMFHFLDDVGHKVVGIARDETSALTQAAAKQQDVVLMGAQLASASDGIETAQKLRSERSVNVVFMTAFGDATNAPAKPPPMGKARRILGGDAAM